MLGIVMLITFAVFRASFLARRGGLNSTVWALLAVVGVLAGMFLGSVIMVFILLAKDPGLLKLIEANRNNQQFMTDYLLRTQNVYIMEIFLMFSGVGGYLFVRHHLLKRLPPEDDSANN